MSFVEILKFANVVAVITLGLFIHEITSDKRYGSRPSVTVMAIDCTLFYLAVFVTSAWAIVLCDWAIVAAKIIANLY